MFGNRTFSFRTLTVLPDNALRTMRSEDEEISKLLNEKKSDFYFQKMLKIVRKDLPLVKPVISMKKGLRVKKFIHNLGHKKRQFCRRVST